MTGSPAAVRAISAFLPSGRVRYRENSCGRSRNRIEPGRQYGAAGRGGGVAVRLVLRAQGGRVDAGLAELDGMANEPAFDTRRLDLDMKLQGKLLRPAAERLDRAGRRRWPPC